MRTESEVLDLFLTNRGLAYWFADKYRHVEEFDDLFQCASIGLWQACQSWDPTISKLSWHATIQMRNEIQKYLRLAGRIRGTSCGKIVRRHISLDALMEAQVE